MKLKFQIDDCRDLSSLFYLLPFQRGYLVNWDQQKTIWDYLFGKSCFNIDTSGLTPLYDLN
jgi:actin-related protein 6